MLGQASNRSQCWRGTHAKASRQVIADTFKDPNVNDSKPVPTAQKAVHSDARIMEDYTSGNSLRKADSITTWHQHLRNMCNETLMPC